METPKKRSEAMALSLQYEGINKLGTLAVVTLSAQPASTADQGNGAEKIAAVVAELSKNITVLGVAFHLQNAPLLGKPYKVDLTPPLDFLKLEYAGAARDIGFQMPPNFVEYMSALAQPAVLIADRLVFHGGCAVVPVPDKDTFETVVGSVGHPFTLQRLCSEAPELIGFLRQYATPQLLRYLVVLQDFRGAKAVAEVVRTLNLYDLVIAESIVSNLVSTGQFQVALRFVGDEIDLQRALVHCVAGRTYKEDAEGEAAGDGVGASGIKENKIKAIGNVKLAVRYKVKFGLSGPEFDYIDDAVRLRTLRWLLHMRYGEGRSPSSLTESPAADGEPENEYAEADEQESAEVWVETVGRSLSGDKEQLADLCVMLAERGDGAMALRLAQHYSLDAVVPRIEAAAQQYEASAAAKKAAGASSGLIALTPASPSPSPMSGVATPFSEQSARDDAVTEGEDDSSSSTSETGGDGNDFSDGRETPVSSGTDVAMTPKTAAATTALPRLRLPIAREDLLFVDTRAGVVEACKILCAADCVGLDGEWCAVMNAGEQQRVALLQIGCRTHAFLFDMIKLTAADIEEPFKELFGSAAVLKLGYGLTHDIAQLRRSFPTVTAFHYVTPCIDLHNLQRYLVPKCRGGLQSLVARLLSKFLSKVEQVSDWERRPLRESQMIYAANDALVLVLCYEVFVAAWDVQPTTGPNAVHLEPSGSHGHAPHGNAAHATPRLAEMVFDITNHTEVQPSRRKSDRKSSSDKTATPSDTSRGHKGGQMIDGAEIADIPGVTAPPQVAPAAFVVDCMLGRLARKLRSAGVSAHCIDRKDYASLQRVSYAMNAVVLTRDKKFLQMGLVGPLSVYCVREQNTDAQFTEILKRFNIELNAKNVFVRCTVCNSDRWTTLTPDQVRGRHRVPEAVLQRYNTFWECDACKQLYWLGSHHPLALEYVNNAINTIRDNSETDGSSATVAGAVDV